MINIQKLKPNEFQAFYDACANVGWENEQLHVECLYKYYSDDFFIAYKNGQVIGYVLAIKESQNFAKLSNLLVLEEFRSLGYAKELIRFALDYLGTRQVSLDCEKELEPIYEKFGFKGYLETCTYYFKSGQINLAKSDIKVSKVSLANILKYNKKNNFIQKEEYVSCLYTAKQSTYCGILKKNELSSYAFRIPFKDTYKIIIVSQDTDEIIALLFELSDALEADTDIYIEINQLEKLLLDVAELYSMQKLFFKTKMYNKIL